MASSSMAVAVARADAPPRANVLLTCEHASLEIPADAWPEGFPEEDAWVVGLHWSVDIGSERLTRELADALEARAVIARFSRLLCDCNRPLDSETLFRKVAEGRSLALNANVTQEERAKRIALLYEPYHAAIDAQLDEAAAAAPATPPVELIFSIHSFTDMYEGQKRDVEVGILYKDHDAVARQLTADIAAAGMVARLNEPWSGLEGFMYSADMHARRIGAQALMIEARQDLIVQDAWRKRLVDVVVASLAAQGFGRK